jgi:hypothetical protein
MRPIWIPVTLLLALALVGAGGQSVAKAAVAFQTPEPLETPLATLAERLGEDTASAVVETAARPTPWVLSTPEPLLTPVPRKPAPKPKAATPAVAPVAPMVLRTPEPVVAIGRPAPRQAARAHSLQPTVIGLPTPGRGAKGATTVYNLVFPVVGAPLPGHDFSVKLVNEPNSNQVEVSLNAKGAQATADTAAPTLPQPGGAVISMVPDAHGFLLQITAPHAREVTFYVDGKPVGADRDAKDGFCLSLDSGRLSSGVHQIKAIARGPHGDVVQTVEHTVIIQR